MITDDYPEWRECLDADNCELIVSFLELVDAMVRDIQHLKAETIRASLVLTPHAGEAARFFDVSPADIGADRGRFGLELAQRLQAVCVMKGARSLICCPDGTVYENPTGNAGMATGGSGDVLTGMTASFAGQLAAQGAKPAEAAKRGALCGVYVHGLAGDLAAEQWGRAGLMASDLADYAALALQSFDKFCGTD